MPIEASELIRLLQLEPHVEGGWFRRTFQADSGLDVATPSGKRPLLTSIYYLLTGESPVGHFHCNRSGIMHYYHGGDPLHYFLLHDDGRFWQVVMGADIACGQRLQLFVPGGVWKASRLEGGQHGYGLISEAVAPGFDYADMRLGKAGELAALCPAQEALISELCRSEAGQD